MKKDKYLVFGGLCSIALAYVIVSFRAGPGTALLSALVWGVIVYVAYRAKK